MPGDSHVAGLAGDHPTPLAAHRSFYKSPSDYSEPAGRQGQSHCFPRGCRLPPTPSPQDDQP